MEEQEGDPGFKRVDVFNVAISPLSSSVELQTTSLYIHRVNGDWASYGLQWMEVSDVEVHEHPVQPHVRERHSLQHFLPRKAADRQADRKQEPERPAEGAGWLATLGALSCAR